MPHSKTITYLLLLAAMLFWGFSYIWSKTVFKYYDPVTTIFLRLLLSSILMYGGLKIAGKAEMIYRSDLKLFLLSSLLNPFLYFLGENFGLKYTTPTISAVIIATIPLFTPLVAHYAIKEKLPLINIIGIIISFAGIVVMLANRDLTLTGELGGIGFLLCAVGCAVGYTILLKRLTERYMPFTIILVQNIIGTIYFVPLFLIFGLRHFLTVRPNAELVTSMLLLAALASSLAFVFFAMAVRKFGVSRTNVFSNTIPIFTGIFSYLILSELFNVNKIAGMIVVMTGVVLTQVNRMNRTTG